MNESRETALAEVATFTRALELCWLGSGVPAKVMAERLGIEYSHFVRMFREHDSRHFPPDLIVRLMEECKSLLPLEWLAWRMGYCLHERTLTAILEALHATMTAAGGEAPRFMLHWLSGRMERV